MRCVVPLLLVLTAPVGAVAQTATIGACDLRALLETIPEATGPASVLRDRASRACRPASARGSGDDLPIRLHHHDWIGTAWVFDARTTLTYAPDDCLVESIQEDSSASSGWQYTSRGTRVCDAAGNTIERISQLWSIGWQNDRRNALTYTAEGLLSSDVLYLWQNASWVAAARTLWEYDAEGRLLRTISQEASDTTWVNFSRLVHTYDAEGRRLEELWELWSGDTWVSFSLRVLSYGAGTDVTSWLSYAWDGTAWVSSSRGTLSHTHDDTGHRILELVELWTGGAWELRSEYYESYRLDGRFEEFRVRTLDGAVWENVIRFTTTYDTAGRQMANIVQHGVGTEWINTTMTTMIYRSGTATDNYPDASTAALTIAPNPTIGVTVVSLTVPIGGSTWAGAYDITGRLVLTLFDGDLPVGRTDVVVQTGALPAGVFLVRAMGAQWSRTARLVVH